MLELRANNPMRPVDWRWQRARLLVENNRRGNRRHDDLPTQLSIKFARALNRAQTRSNYLPLIDEFPEFYESWNLYQDTTATPWRWELEARILAGESIPQIAAKQGISAGTIAIYEACFFNVLPKLDCQSYIHQQVLKPSAAAGLRGRESDMLWKLYGYWGGPHVLDSIVYECQRQARPDGPASVSAFWQDDIKDSLQRKAAIAVRTMPIDWQTRLEIINLYLRMVEMERIAGEGKGSNESMLANIDAMLHQLPWQKRETPIEGQVVPALEAAGVGVRAGELAVLGIASSLPADMEKFLLSAVFPQLPSNIPNVDSHTEQGE